MKKIPRWLPLFALLVPTAIAGGNPDDFRYKVEILAEGLIQPMHLEAAPDGRIFFSEIQGAVKVFDPVTRDVKVVGKLEVTNEMELGLIGMALDPGFAENHWMYLLHSPPGKNAQVLSRYTIVDDELETRSRVDLLEIPEQWRECCHHGGTLRFGPDGNLFISTGDNTNPFGSDGFSPIDEREDRDPWDAQKSSGNTNDLRGKILRIRPLPDGSYEIPQGNLFPRGTPNSRAEIYAMGFRNPWRFSIDPAGGTLYVGDVGPDSGSDGENRGPSGFDTLNRISVPGNYGWPYSRGGRVYHDFDFTTQSPGEEFDAASPVNDSPNNTGLRDLPAIQPPLVWYPGSPTDQFPMLGGGGRTACGGPVFHFKESFRETGGFPESLDGGVLFYDWQRPFMVWLHLDDEGNLREMQPFTGALKVAQGAQDRDGPIKLRRPVDLMFGSDGALYVLDYGETWGENPDARLLRISYQWGNLDPIAKIRGDQLSGPAPLKVSLSAADSSDPEGDELSYEWRLRPGDVIVATGESADLELSEPGDYTLSVLVNDGNGGSARSEVPIVVGNSQPKITFLEPREGTLVSPGETLEYRVAVVDAEDGNSEDHAATMGPRTLVNSVWSAGGKFAVEDEPGLAMMKQAGCFNCHSTDQTLVGPPLIEIAERYRGDPSAIDRAVNRVISGSVGVWGELGMLPHPHLDLDQTHIIVRWIFSLERGKSSPAMICGLEGAIQVPDGDALLDRGLLEATYTDLGNLPASVLSATASIRLRARKIQLELQVPHGPAVLDGTGSDGGFVGAIDHLHAVNLGVLDLQDSRQAVFRASSGNVGGTIELRAGAADGKPIAQVEVPPTGGWDQWREFTADLIGSEGNAEVWVVFLNPGNSGLLNLDWVRFDR